MLKRDLELPLGATCCVVPAAPPPGSLKVPIVTMPSTSSISWRASGRTLSTAARIHSRSLGATDGSKVNVAARTVRIERVLVLPAAGRARPPRRRPGRAELGGTHVPVDRQARAGLDRRVRRVDMSSISAGGSGRRGARSGGAWQSWFAALGVKGRRAFRAAFAGYMLDAFDLIVLTLSLTAIGATFDVGTGATGALSTVTLSASAIGGILGGVLADRIGRARTLMLSVAIYSLFTFLSGLASSYEMLLVFRVFQGIGFGAEWGVGAVLVAELVRPESRGRALGVDPERVGGRLGAGRRRVPDLVRAVRGDDGVAGADVPRHPAGAADPLRALARRGPGGLPRGASRDRSDEVPLRQILSGKLLKTTIAASLLATGIQGGYYAMFTWIPTYLKKERDLTIVGTSRLPVRGHRGRVPGLPVRRVGARPARPAAGVRALRGAGGRLAGGVLPRPGGLEHDAAAGRLPARLLRLRLLLGLRLLPGRAVPDAGAGDR